MGKKNASVKIVCENRKARHDYMMVDRAVMFAGSS